ncbi:hypothetical protein BDP27DRAFT_1373282 [Rhodocollybia butyracea]|uniref:AMP-dependent synthetase/ligase domain-containing protein n=1 Tax=Rhodocollybia butyracea TaxID=206335 RepID=A0A9P5P938_9AGAR|nr:hypothetical protein BDP27DRAFT_1373282 [Rhodocollybia butyracea]
MSFHTAQGLHSSTFSPPPDAGEGFNIVTLHDFHAKHSPNHPVFRYMTDNHQGIRTIFWNEAVRAFYAASLFVRAMVKTDAVNPVVSILASLDPITYFALVEGIMRAGYTPFPISTRNSDIAIAHLLKTTDSQHLFVSQDIAMQELAAKACSRLVPVDGDVNGKAKQNPITIFSTPVFEDLFQEQGSKLESSTIIKTERTAIILHSSGSTSVFPRPIGISHRDFLSRGKVHFQAHDYCGEIMSIAGIPMYHIMGLGRMVETAKTGIAPLSNGSARLSLGQNLNGGTEVMAACILISFSISSSLIWSSRRSSVQSDNGGPTPNFVASISASQKSGYNISKKAWLLNLNLLVLADAGNIYDALFMAAKAPPWYYLLLQLQLLLLSSVTLPAKWHSFMIFYRTRTCHALGAVAHTHKYYYLGGQEQYLNLIAGSDWRDACDIAAFKPSSRPDPRKYLSCHSRYKIYYDIYRPFSPRGRQPFSKEWAKDPRKIEALKVFKRVQVSGGSLVTSVGDILNRGRTDDGAQMQVFHGQQLGAMIDPFLVPSYQYGENIYRLIVKKCKTHSPAIFNTTVDGQPAFDTNDLLVRHPINPNMFRVHGRAGKSSSY